MTGQLSPTQPNIEERLTAAALVILTDGQRHAHQAQAWATRFLRFAARGRDTSFQRRLHAGRRKSVSAEGVGA